MKLYFILIAVSVLMIGGCSNKYDAQMAESYYKSQSSEDKPILSITAKAGETISFQGVKNFEVYAPGNQEPVRQFKKQYHPAWSILGQTLQYAAPAMVSGYWANELVGSVGKYAGDRIGGNSVGGDYDASDNSIGGDSVGGDKIGGDSVAGDYDASDNSIGGDSVAGDNIGGDYDASDNSVDENWTDDNSDNSENWTDDNSDNSENWTDDNSTTNP